MAIVAVSEAAAAPAVALELWWGKVANRLATKVEAATEAAAVMVVTEAVAEAAAAGCTTAAAVSWRRWWWWQMRRQRRRPQQQWWRRQRIKGSGNSKVSEGNIGSGDRVLRVCFFSQIHFLRCILRKPHTDRFPDDVPKHLRRNRNHVSCEKNTT